MINFVENKKEFENYKNQYLKLFDPEKRFQDNPFKSNFNYFIGFDFNFIFSEVFFSSIKDFVKKIKSEHLFFYTIEPSPEEYFFKYFKKYNVLNIKLTDTEMDLNNIMMKDPLDSPSDALAINSNEISWFSNSDDWAIIGSREWEISIVGFTSLEMKGKFLSSFGDNLDIFTSIEQQVHILDDMLNFDKELKADYNELTKNYQDRE